MNSFKSLKRSSEAILKEKGSKFIAFAYPIQNKEDVYEKLALLKKKHPKANHICTAFLLIENKQEYFLTNDDGEPSNSAGMPILGQIRSHELHNTFIAVVRYFGGTKLGVGGLISAYKTAASMTIRENDIIQIEPKTELSMVLDYSSLGDALSIIDKNQLESTQIHQDKKCSIILYVKPGVVEKVIELFKPLGIKLEEI